MANPFSLESIAPKPTSQPTVGIPQVNNPVVPKSPVPIKKDPIWGTPKPVTPPQITQQDTSQQTQTTTPTTPTPGKPVLGLSAQDNAKMDAIMKAHGYTPPPQPGQPQDWFAKTAPPKKGAYTLGSFGKALLGPIGLMHTLATDKDKSTEALNTVGDATGALGMAKAAAQGIGPKSYTPEVSKSMQDTAQQLYDSAMKQPEGSPRRQHLLDVYKQTIANDADLRDKFKDEYSTTEQVLGSAGKLALTVGTAGLGSEAGGTATLGQKVLQGVATGGKIGTAYGVAQGMEDKGNLEDVAKSGVIYGLAGAGTGGALPLVAKAGSKIIEGTSNVLDNFKSPSQLAKDARDAITGKIANTSKKVGGLIKGKTQEQIMATAEKDVAKLAPAERKVYFDTKRAEVTQAHQAEFEKINQTHANTEAKIQSEAKIKLDTLQKESETLQRQLATSSRDEVLALRPKIRTAMAKQSAQYRSIVQEELAPHAQNTVKTSDINSFIDSKFSDNPDMARAIKMKLNTVEEVPTASGVASRLDSGDVPKVREQTTIGELYDLTQKLKQGVGNGSRVYSPDEKMTDDAVHTLTEYMKSQGVDLKNSRSFWAKYAPVRDQLMAEAKPFLQAPIKTKTFAGTLTRVAQGTDVNNENFIRET